MSGAPRVAFAGLAHSHPHTDAAGAAALGAQVVAVYDSDATAAGDFAERFGGVAVDSPDILIAHRPDVIVATPRPDEVLSTLRALRETAAAVPVFFNKVLAATEQQFADVDRALAVQRKSVGTASVLRFAPALAQLAAELSGDEIFSIRAHAQHDNEAFRLPDRRWQDDPAQGGGTLVTVGVHAWQMIDRAVPGAILESAVGWTARSSDTLSEDVGGIQGRLRLADGRAISVQATVSGVPGADRYSLEVISARGVHTIDLDVDDALEQLGFRGLVRALIDDAPRGEVPAPWAEARAVVANTIHAARAARGEQPTDFGLPMEDPPGLRP